jgi:hypothetical protein
MRGIRSVIIDDEATNRHVLSMMLKEHCPSIELIGDGASVEEGYELICSNLRCYSFTILAVPIDCVPFSKFRM